MPAPRRILIDANLLVLWIFGHVAPDMIGTRRTAKYTVEYFKLLQDLLLEYEEFLITPSVATEVSNLIGTLQGKHLHKARRILQASLQIWTEVYEDSRTLSGNPAFAWAGLTDVAIRSAAHEGVVALTDDGPLHGWLCREGVNAINFTHLRFPRS